MAGGFEPDALFGHVYTLRNGLPVRLRLARSSDAAAVRALLELRVPGDDLEPVRLVHFDPRRRYVICVTGLVEKSETLLGIGAITLDGATEPELLVVGGEPPEELAELLHRALVASAAARSRAA